MKRSVFLMVLGVMLGCGAMTVAMAQNGPVDVQALIGVVRWKEKDSRLSSTGETVSNDISDAPVIGIAGQMPLVPGLNTIGFEAGSTLTWWKQGSSWYLSSSGSGAVSVDVSAQVVDLFAGIYLSSEALQRTRLYAGAGPTFVMAWNNDSDYYVTDVNGNPVLLYDRSYDSALGFYGRAGVEFQLMDGSYMGVAYRYLEASLDFGGELGKVDMAGSEGLITYTQRF